MWLFETYSAYTAQLVALYETVYFQKQNTTTFYIGEPFSDSSGPTTRTVGKIGTLKEQQEKLGPAVDVKEWYKEYVRKINDKVDQPISLKLDLTVGQSYEKGEQRNFNVGYLMLSPTV